MLFKVGVYVCIHSRLRESLVESMSGYSFACGVKFWTWPIHGKKTPAQAERSISLKSIMPASSDRKLMRFAAMAASYWLDRRRGEQGYKYRSASVIHRGG